MTVYVDFEPIGRRGECPDGHSLLDCARQLGVELVNLCGGHGSCGRCVVQVMTGTVSDPAPDEEKFLTSDQLQAGYRLACRTLPLGDCKVRVPPESLSTPQRAQVESEVYRVAVAPPVRVYRVSAPPPSLEDLRGDAERLLAALNEQHGLAVSTVDVQALRAIPTHLRIQDWTVQVAVRDGREIVALLPPAAHPLGLAVDLGTTKIAVYLLDLLSGETLAARGMMNPQIAYGEDVIARITYAQQAPKGAEHLQELVVSALGQAVVEMTAQVEAKAAHVVEAVVVGNTAMHHLFVGLPVGPLAQAPYVPAVTSTLDIKARDLGLTIAPGAYIHLLPNIAGYVGADHVAALLATDIAHTGDTTLLLDIGTNTEVCLVHRGRMTSLSCASGPAFEGAHISCGMRAAPGAIEHVRLIGDWVEFQTIGDGPPVGMCGSGILDALAQLRRAGVVDRRGRIGDHPRVREGHAGREFVWVDGGDGRPEITMTQKDVSELQLAKGAIRAGVEVLLRTHGLTPDDIQQVIIAGAFGSYVDISSAIAIGMLPAIPTERVRQIGNAAGLGARLALVSQKKRTEARHLGQQVQYIELASTPQFSLVFAQAMYLE